MNLRDEALYFRDMTERPRHNFFPVPLPKEIIHTLCIYILFLLGSINRNIVLVFIETFRIKLFKCSLDFEDKQNTGVKTDK